MERRTIKSPKLDSGNCCNWVEFRRCARMFVWLRLSIISSSKMLRSSHIFPPNTFLEYCWQRKKSKLMTANHFISCIPKYDHREATVYIVADGLSSCTSFRAWPLSCHVKINNQAGLYKLIQLRSI